MKTTRTATRPRQTFLRGGVAITLLLCGLLTGCEKSTAPPKLDAARQLLARDKNQAAIDALNGVSVAEASYLRAIALFRLGLEEAAKEQVAAAVTADSSNPLYRAFELRDKTLGAKADREKLADELLTLCREHPSDPAFSLFAATGYGAKQDAQAAVEAFRTAVALSGKIPEFWPEMLNMAISTGCVAEAETLLEKMEQANPDDTFLVKQKVLVLVANRKVPEAIAVARKEYDRTEQSSEAAMLLAQALRASPPGTETDTALNDLVKRHPEHTSLVILAATYFAQTGRLPLGITLLNDTYAKLPAEKRSALAPALIGLPLEVGNAAAAEQQLLKYRAALGDPVLASYYDGRLYFLKKQYAKSVELLTGVAKSLQAGNRPEQRNMLQEAMFWMQKAKWEEQVERRIQAAIESASEDQPAPGETPAKEAATAPKSAD